MGFGAGGGMHFDVFYVATLGTPAGMTRFRA